MSNISQTSICESNFRKLCDDNQAMSIQGYDAEGKVVYWNSASEKMYGYSAAEALGKTLYELIIPAPMQDDVKAAVAWMFEHREGIPAARLDLQHKSGSPVPVYSSHTVVEVADQQPIMFCMDTDLRALQVVEAEVQRLSYFDSLTELPNRRLLLERLDGLTKAPVLERNISALMLIDIDNFHSINDSLGFDIGDQVLTHCAKRLKKLSDTQDGLARLGKDEFIFVYSDLGQDMAQAATQAEQCARCILEALHHPITLNKSIHKLNVRIGITLFGHSGRVAGSTLISQADIALKAAKQQADDNISFFDRTMQDALHQRLRLSQALNHAIAEQQLSIVYQPQVDSQQQLLSCEALLRWEHPEFGTIAPADFIPIAEANGSIVEIGEWVLESCVQTLVEWSKQPKFADLSLAINVSAMQFRQTNFVERVQQCIERSGVDPTKLRFELTESLMADDIGRITQQMTQLRALGISLSLDDFGTGYASLAYLTQLPLDELKIDRAFVNDLEHDGKGALLAKTIISLGQSMNLAVIAEGVETQAQFLRLQELGCELFQGYLFGRPSRTVSPP